MRSVTAMTIIVAFIAVGCSEKKESAVMLHAANFLPQNIDASALERTSEIQTFEGQALYEHINGGAEIYHLYDFVEVATAYYSAGELEIMADIYMFADADMAYGLFTAIRPENPDPVAIGVEGFKSEASLDFVNGQFVVKLVGYDDSPETGAAIDAIGATLGQILPGGTALPQNFSLFPDNDRLPYTNKIYAKSYLGQPSLDEVYCQTYILEGDTVTLFVTDDPGGTKYLSWAERVKTNPTANQTEGVYTFDDGMSRQITDNYYGNIVFGLKSGLLIGVINYNSRHETFLNAWLDSLGGRKT